MLDTLGIDYVVEYKLPTSSDKSWYRIYKSGFKEMGGVTEAWFRGSTNIITYPKSFTIRPTFVCTLSTTNGECNEMRVAVGTTSNNAGTDYVTTTQAQVYIHGISGSGTDGGPVSWYAFGV